MSNKKDAFTLIELVAVLVIMAIIALIATPLVLSLINNAKASANKRSVDAYGKAVEMAAMTYLMDNGEYPTGLGSLTVEYTGKEVTCKVMNLNEDGSIYLSECSVGGTEVKDKNTEDGWYHYGKFDETTKANTAVSTLLSKANDASVTTYDAGSDASHELYTFNHEATVQTEALTDYRYIGNDPYNYVTFNDELWRIIGVFTVEGSSGEKEQRIKIIRDEIIGEYPWDYTEYNSDYGEYDGGINEWATAKLNTYLNGDYYNSLSTEAQGMIAATKFYLGGSDTVENHSALTYYSFERGEEVHDESRSKNWIGNIGLVYSSDYIYTYANGVDEKCYTDTFNCESSSSISGWLYKEDYEDDEISFWTISPFIAYADIALGVSFGGYVTDIGVNDSRGVRPSLYLSSSVSIVDGDGSEDNPYQLSM